MAPRGLTQVGRPIVLTTPLGEDKLFALEITAREGLSRLFSFEVDAFAHVEDRVDFSKLLGADCSVHVTVTPETKEKPAADRHFHGICSRVEEGDQNNDFLHYRLTLVPKLWLLTRRAQSRTFQQMSVPDILKKVLTGIDAKYEIQGTFEPRDYCAQYRESDFDFASRLMEEEGIFYFFTHDKAGHKLVVGNTPQSHLDLPESAQIQFEEDLTNRDADRVHCWRKSQELRSGKAVLWDHSFELPGKHLEAEKLVAPTVEVGESSHKLKVADNEKLELYDYPGAYAQRFDGIDPGGAEQASNLQKIFTDNKRTVELRMQAETSAAMLVTGTGTAVRLRAGHAFTLSRHPGKANGKYVLTSVVHRASGGGNYASGEVDPFRYANSFECIPAALPWRPPRVTPRPFVRGTQTAIVVGPSGQEIFTDKYGRVKVQFPWDREGKNDAKSSCWVRVATSSAGKNWGAIHIPRVGQEVVVDFLEGDPDQPIIVGSVYNADQMPPYALPDNKTQSGIKTRSTDKGSAETFNELRFEDKKGKEEIYFHAERNFTRIVENDDVLTVGVESKGQDKGTQTITIHGNRTETVKEGNEAVTIEKGNRTVTVKEGHEVLTIGKGDRTVTVEKGHEVLTVSKGNRTVTVTKGNDVHEVKEGGRTAKIAADDVTTVEKGNYTLTISQGNRTTDIKAGSDKLEAAQSIEFKVGGSSIKIEPAGITIKSTKITIEATAQLEMKGAMSKLEGSATCDVTGALAKVQASGILTLKGSLTMIN